ncbi:MAG: anthranilate phosphoribosyltransferase [Candidatus Hydrogenedentota bacterium]
MAITEAIAAVCAGEHLTRAAAAHAMQVLMAGEASPAQAAAFLIALHVRGESVDEIAGFAETMRHFATKVPTKRSPLVDTCGTGGDHSGTFNISTAAAFVVAGAGIAVAKHGNRSATSRCGSADVLEALGVSIDCGPGHVGRCIDEAGVGFLFARSLHNAMRHVAPVRAEVGVRTVFNVLGPLTNPAGADRQVMGVYSGSLVRPIAEVLLRLGARHVFVVHGDDGLDEMSLTGPTRVAEARGGAVKEYRLTPAEFGLDTASSEVFRGGDAAMNAEILRDVLEGKPGPRRDIVLLNAAPAIVAGEKAEDLRGGIECARQAIDSGAALDKLEQLVKLSHDSR